MATTKKGTTTKDPASKAEAGARKRTTRNTATAPAEGAARTSPAKPKTASKTAAPAVKLTDGQKNLLARIDAAGEAGFETTNKNEQRSIDALSLRKLLKRGTKVKGTDRYRYLLTKAGKALLPASSD